MTDAGHFTEQNSASAGRSSRDGFPITVSVLICNNVLRACKGVISLAFKYLFQELLDRCYFDVLVSFQIQ